MVRTRGPEIHVRYRAKALTARPSFDNSNSPRLFSPPVQVFFSQKQQNDHKGRLVVLVREKQHFLNTSVV
jgi:hypothetical protein